MNKAESRKQKAESRKQKAESRKQKDYVSFESRVKCLGFIEKGTGKHQSNCVYSVEGLSPTICAGLGVKMPGLYIVVD